MPLITIVITLMIVGVLLWLIETYVPMAAPIKTLIRVVVVLAAVIWVLQAVGLWGPVSGFRVGP